MIASAEPSIEVQKGYWKFWNTRPGYPHDRALRRGEKIVGYLLGLGLDRPRILDLGCGMGWLSGELAQFGPTTGIDLSEEAIDRARQEYPQATFYAGDVLDMELAEGQFDVVVSQEVIAHVPDQVEYLERAAWALRPGGYLILTTPNPFVHRRAEWPEQPPGHLEHWLTPRELNGLLRRRFRVLKRTTAVPLGNRGILWVVNSPRLGRLLEAIMTPRRLESMKEWAGFGWTQVALARKK
ncbi:class I SAM-dependent methyltransferase (plasmid) [Tundrisphaera lichenicola]|uniref:class I SAM-dependent methyltransferase n=1 Tax=Tundrisphaera lichenicola TaxID=2029860 RepID=UPI003EB77420